jgi:hypothetical protein
VRFAERDTAPDEQVGEVGGREEVVARGVLHPAAVEVQLADHLARHLKLELERVDRVEQALLVLLEVLVVGERQPVQHSVERREV